MSTQLKNILFLLFFLITTYYIGDKMKKWMPTKQVVQFEFIGTAIEAEAYLNDPEVDTAGRNRADRLRHATHLDFLYILSYAGLFIFLARTGLSKQEIQVQNLTRLVLAAAVADLGENICLLQILDGGRGFYPATMYGFAALKFGCLALFVVWFLIAVVQRLFRKQG